MNFANIFCTDGSAASAWQHCNGHRRTDAGGPQLWRSSLFSLSSFAPQSQDKQGWCGVQISID